MVGTANGSRTPVTPRQAFSVVNGGQDPGLRSGPGSIAGSDCGVMEITREEIDALLNNKIRTKDKFNLKEKNEIMTDYIKRLRMCVKWFQEFEGGLSLEHEKLKKLFESAEKKSNEMERLMNAKEEELNSIIEELRTNYYVLQERFVNEEAEKLAVIELLAAEKDARMTAEQSQASLTKDLEKALRESSSLNQKISSLTDMYKRLQEYNASLQHYNSKLQTELNQTSETLNKVEREKAALMENLSNFRGYHESQQDQLTSTKASLEESLKLNDALASEVGCWRGDLHHLREDRDRQLSLVQDLTAEVVQYKESTGKSATELGTLTSPPHVDQVGSSSSQRPPTQQTPALATRVVNRRVPQSGQYMAETLEQSREIVHLQREVHAVTIWQARQIERYLRERGFEPDPFPTIVPYVPPVDPAIGEAAAGPSAGDTACSGASTGDAAGAGASAGDATNAGASAFAGDDFGADLD